ncbi:hypothetical protein CGUA_01845 [Corynebacterium guangdongense]|nr:hypothetical protein CGUA_01845 [Corynebacterium guangdongense]
MAVLGVVATGVTLSEDNTAADAFYHATGVIGLRMFGIVLGAAGLSSVIDASYTSISFITTQKTAPKLRAGLTVTFIVACATAYLALNQAPQAMLIFAGAFNGFILPIGFAVVMWITVCRPATSTRSG